MLALTKPTLYCLPLAAPNMDMPAAPVVIILADRSFYQVVQAMQEKKFKHNGRHITTISWTASHASMSPPSRLDFYILPPDRLRGDDDSRYFS